MKEYLLRQGFSRVVTLRPADCSIETQEQTLYLCLWSYLPAELPEPGTAATTPIIRPPKGFSNGTSGGGRGNGTRTAPAAGYGFAAQAYLCAFAWVQPGL